MGELTFKLKTKRKPYIVEVLDDDWKDIPGFPHYKINKYGQVKRIDAVVVDCNGISFYRKGRILRTRKTKLGYVQVDMCENGVVYGRFIHNLLAKVFIPNPNNFPVVNHKDENPSNNDLSNLEWCNHSYNARYSIEKIKKAHAKEQTPVARIDRFTKEETRYDGVREAARMNNLCHSNISSAIRRGGTCGGYKWRYCE